MADVFFWIFRHMNFKLKHPLLTLLTGVLALLPLAATLRAYSS